MGSSDSDRDAFPRLEILLALAVLCLLAQLFPSLTVNALWALDVRNWSIAGWLVAVMAVGTIFACIRYGPDAINSHRNKSAMRARKRAQTDKQHRSIAARELRQAIEEGRKRRIY